MVLKIFVLKMAQAKTRIWPCGRVRLPGSKPGIYTKESSWDFYKLYERNSLDKSNLLCDAMRCKYPRSGLQREILNNTEMDHP